MAGVSCRMDEKFEEINREYRLSDDVLNTFSIHHRL